MEYEHDSLSPQERSLLDILRSKGIRFSDQSDSGDIRDLLAREVKNFFHRITTDGLEKLFNALCQKGHLIRDGEGWFRLAGSDSYTDIVIAGKITAGYLQTAIRNELGFVRFDGTLNQPNQLFALEVDGESMVDDDIHDGDCVLLRYGDVQNGQIGAVEIDGKTTLKRVFREYNGVKLVPSNPLFDPIFLPADEFFDCTILGRLEAVICKTTGDVRWISSGRNTTTQISLFLN